MQANTEATLLLYVTDRGADADGEQFGFDQRSVSITTRTAETVRGASSVGQFDCVLVDTSLGPDLHDTVLALREQYSTTPILVFTGDRDGETLDALLATDGVTVIPDSVTQVPESLVRDRIDAALSTVAPAADDHSRLPAAERDRLHRTITQSIDDVVWVLDVETESILFVNEAYEQIWGRSRERLYERREAFLDGVHPGDRDRVREVVERLPLDPDSYSLTYRVVKPGGETRWVRDRAFGVYEDGSLKRVVGLIQDITRQKRREAQLELERDLIEHVYETSPVGICVFDRDGSFTRANERAATILGSTTEKILERTYDDDSWTIRDIDGERIPAEQFPPARVFETGNPIYDWEGQIERPDGTRRWISANASPLSDDCEDIDRVVVSFEDVTERKRREEQIQTQRDDLAELDRINRIIRDVDAALVGAQTRADIERAVCERLAGSEKYHFAVSLQLDSDGDLEPSEWTSAGEEYVERAFSVDPDAPGPGARALETGEVHIVQSVSDGRKTWQEIATAVGIEGLAAVPVIYDGREYGVIAVYTTEPEAFGEREMEVLGELGETVGYAIAAVQSREREQTLTALYEATQELLGAETEQAVCDVVVDTAADVLGPSGIGVFLFDDHDNVLRPAAATDELRSFYTGTTTFGPGHADSETWQAYATGESRYFPDIRTADHLIDPETDARSTLMLPLGEHGVFVVVSRQVDSFDEQKRQLVGLLAATTEAALDRVSGREDLRERDQQLAKHTDRLVRLEQTLQFVRDTHQLIRTANTRAEIESGVCDALTAVEEHTLTWIGTTPPEGNELVTQTYAGSGDCYLDVVSLSLEGDEPAVVAARTGRPVSTPSVTDRLHDTDWAHLAADRAFQSALAVPLVYGETSYGVLAVYSDEPNTFGGGFEMMLDNVAKTIAYGINTVETRQGILADCVTELQLRLDGANGFPNAVADIADTTITFREIQPTVDGGTQLLFGLANPPVEEILALETEFVSVKSLSHLNRGGEQLFRATLSGGTVATTLFDCGGIPREVVATPSETTAVVQLPQELDVRVFLDRLDTHYTNIEMLSRNDVESQENRPDQVWSVIQTELTDRQREVLLTAYESGYFESPRETTGAELADLFDLSQPTVTYHLREAQRRLFASMASDSS